MDGDKKIIIVGDGVKLTFYNYPSSIIDKIFQTLSDIAFESDDAYYTEEYYDQEVEECQEKN